MWYNNNELVLRLWLCLGLALGLVFKWCRFCRKRHRHYAHARQRRRTNIYSMSHRCRFLFHLPVFSAPSSSLVRKILTEPLVPTPWKIVLPTPLLGRLAQTPIPMVISTQSVRALIPKTWRRFIAVLMSRTDELRRVAAWWRWLRARNFCVHFHDRISSIIAPSLQRHVNTIVLAPAT